MRILTSHDYEGPDSHVRWRATFQEIESHHCFLHVHELDVCGQDDNAEAKPVLVVNVKWDGCAHVGFRDEALGSNWVHVCGADSMADVLRMMQWAWNLCIDKLEEYQDEPGVSKLDIVKDTE
jgi:hypothetical protein